MNPYPIPAFTDNYIWAIIDETIGLFDCVDPGDAQPVMHFAQVNNLSLRSILLTHHHNDHIGGVKELLALFPNCPVYGPNDTRIPYVSNPLTAHAIISLGQNCFEILSNPGHTSSHISYYEQKKGWLFCGDTLFSAGCGRVFDGTIEDLHTSLMMFKNLPETTKIFCAHEYTRDNLKFAQHVEPHNSIIKSYEKTLNERLELCSLPSTLALELNINPFLRTHIEEVKDYALKHGAMSSDPVDLFKVLRDQKNNFKY